MKINIKCTAVLFYTLIVGIFIGITEHKYNLFPLKQIQEINNTYFRDENVPSWSISIYKGTTPFNISDPEDIDNPVLKAEDVTDIEASFVADPFMFIKNGQYTMFFEVLNAENYQGDIGYAVSKDGKKWDYKKIIIDENFHLSYPQVFEWEGEHYLIPESNEDFSIRLYKAKSFPDEWEYVGDLMGGFRYVDPTIFRHNGKWWMFVSTLTNDVLSVFHSDNLLEGWTPHSLNPVMKSNQDHSRPGGRVISYNGKLYRFAQDDFPTYGNQVNAFEITELTETTYEEKMIPNQPMLTYTGKGWNAAGMHHVDSHFENGGWISVVDGKN